MKPHLQEKLSLPPEELFTRGACHVFADELLTRLAPGDHVLKRLVQEGATIGGDGAKHVVVAHSGNVIDIMGKRPESECLQEYRDKLEGRIEFVVCSQEELFTPEAWPLADGKRGISNRWRLNIEVDFVDACRAIARSAIDSNPRKFGLT